MGRILLTKKPRYTPQHAAGPVIKRGRFSRLRLYSNMEKLHFRSHCVGGS
uniref:Uncharacterized protein n=1 Tax=Siphoviridae sp. ct5co22 TaxID=2826294 RepID=A0A8S5QUH5_9CAUD|nr:MAG TPA: hypothetical protein [Siphoviridae sp. ct5co22]